MIGLALKVLVSGLVALTLAGCDLPPEQALTTTALPVPAAGGSAEPHLAGGRDGPAVLSWLEPTPYGSALRYSVLGSDGWEVSQRVAQGSDWFVNWADFPSVVPLSNSLWAAHWLERREGSVYAYDIAVSISADGGLSWGDVVRPHVDGTATEHGFVSLFPWQTGIGALWLDGRNTVDGGGMTLRSAVMTADGELGNPALVDDLVCDCCQTDVAMGRDGPIAVYRNRSEDEIRDIYVVRAVNGVWQAPRAVAGDGWEIAGCPVNGPAVDVAADRVAVAWYTAAAGVPRVRLAFSQDDAESFGQPIDVATDRPLGRVDVVLLSNGDAIVSWLERGGEGAADIRVRRVSSVGSSTESHLIANTGSGRASGFSQMILIDDQLLFAWTDTREEWPQVRAAKVAVSLVR